MILALETATNVCSVVFKDGEGNLYERRSEERGNHSENLFIFIEELMAEHEFAIPDLKAVLVSEGPGSYTGLRISASAIKGLLFQTEVPLYSINTLAGFARSAADAGSPKNSIHSVIDARRVHLYHQQFSLTGEKLSAETEVDILPIETVRSLLKKGDILIGTGINRLDEGKPGGLTVYDQQYISARSLISLYETGEDPFVNRVSPEAFDPKYYTTGQVER